MSVRPEVDFEPLAARLRDGTEVTMRAIRTEDADKLQAATDGDCEFAVAVVDEWHGRGLVRLLLETLMRPARARGFARMEGYILATNAAMLGLAKRLGFAPIASPEGPTVCLLQRDFGTVA